LAGIFLVREVVPALWQTTLAKLDEIHVPLMASIVQAVSPDTSDGTSISGLKRMVRYTANQEEDLLNAASISLVKTGNNITAGSYIVTDLTQKKPPFVYNADRLLPIASLTKLITAVVAAKTFEPDDRISITPQIIATYGNTASFRNGETFRAADLLYPLLMVSSNDAAEAFARTAGRTQFLRDMNDFTQSIGAYRTHFSDPSGLSPDNVSTAAYIWQSF